jgi:hypothetical protein
MTFMDIRVRRFSHSFLSFPMLCILQTTVIGKATYAKMSRQTKMDLTVSVQSYSKGLNTRSNQTGSELSGFRIMYIICWLLNTFRSLYSFVNNFMLSSWVRTSIPCAWLLCAHQHLPNRLTDIYETRNRLRVTGDQLIFAFSISDDL